MSVKINLSEERDLLLQLQLGDQDAYLILYNRYKRQITQKLLSLLKSSEIVQDALQDIFIRVWEKRESINPDLPFAAFLHVLVRHQVSDIIRKAHQDERLQQQLIIQTPVDYSHIDDLIARRENIKLVHQALEQLPARQREVFTLHKLEGKSYKEISELLGISPSAINQHVYRATQHLSRILNPTLCALLVTALALLNQEI